MMGIHCRASLRLALVPLLAGCVLREAPRSSGPGAAPPAEAHPAAAPFEAPEIAIIDVDCPDDECRDHGVETLFAYRRCLGHAANEPVELGWTITFARRRDARTFEREAAARGWQVSDHRSGLWPHVRRVTATVDEGAGAAMLRQIEALVGPEPEISCPAFGGADVIEVVQT